MFQRLHRSFRTLTSSKNFSFSDKIVRIKYNDLVGTKDKSSFFGDIKAAYGREGLGLLVVEKVPQYYQAKSELFQLSHKLVNLPKSSLDKLERPELNYGIGWSFGKEYFDDKPDFFKASYYSMLPQYGTDEHSDNVWPDEIPALKSSVSKLGNIIREVGFDLLGVIDSYIKSKYPRYSLDYSKIIKESTNNTCRVLYYFPRGNNQTHDDWCGWHNDHSSLTGLASASYLDKDGKELSGIKLERTGLYIQTRKGETVKAIFGPEDIAYQLGETLQIHSGGVLDATPHSVKVYNDIPSDVARCTFALFMGPNRDVPMSVPEGSKIENIVTSDIYQVPKVQDRFKPGMTFGEFNDITLASFAEKPTKM